MEAPFLLAYVSAIVLSCAVMQVPFKTLQITHANEPYQHLYSCSGHFIGPELRQSTVKIGTCAVMNIVERMTLLL